MFTVRAAISSARPPTPLLLLALLDVLVLAGALGPLLDSAWGHSDLLRSFSAGLPDYPRLMRETIGPPLRAAAIVAFILGLVLLFLNPPSFAGIGDLIALLAGALAIVLVTAWVTVALIGRETPEEEFRELEDRSEALAALPPPDYPPTEFDLLVMQALDGLPDEFRELLRDAR